jgi:hypothetical protein
MLAEALYTLVSCQMMEDIINLISMRVSLQSYRAIYSRIEHHVRIRDSKSIGRANDMKIRAGRSTYERRVLYDIASIGKPSNDDKLSRPHTFILEIYLLGYQ